MGCYIILMGFSSVNHPAIFLMLLGYPHYGNFPKRNALEARSTSPTPPGSHDLRMIGRAHGHLQHNQLDGVVEDQLHGGVIFPLRQHGLS